MKVRKEVFGLINGEKVMRYVLTNSHRTRIAVLSLGGTLQEFSVFENGRERPLTVGLKTLAEYQHNVFNINQSVGRVAGRIGRAQFELDGQTYHVDANEHGHSLHGGFHGFTTVNFAGQTNKEDDEASVTLTHHVKATDDNYPGNLALRFRFTLNEADQVTIEYGAQTDAPTLFDPTNHVYWNVTDGQRDLEHQWLQIHGCQRVETDIEKIPTGKLLSVVDTAYDFRHPRGLQGALAGLRATTGKREFDDAYQVDAPWGEPVVSVGDDAGQRRIDIYSDRNGVVVFTANPTDAARQQTQDYNALATEVQTLPDAINHPGFGDVILRPDRPVNRHIMFDYHYLGQ